MLPSQRLLYQLDIIIDKITSLLYMAVLLYVKKYCNTTSKI